MPPSPWIGSTRMAPVSGPIAASSASWSPNGRTSKPGSSGSSPSVSFLLPAADTPAMVRPWKAPSKVMMRQRSGSPARPVVAPHGLDRTLDRLGPGIADEDRVGEGMGDQPVGQPLELGDVEEVRGVPQAPGLLRQRADEVRVGMAEAGHGDARAEVEHAAAVGGDQPGTLASLEGEIVAPVDGQQRRQRLIVHVSHPRGTAEGAGHAAGSRLQLVAPAHEPQGEKPQSRYSRTAGPRCRPRPSRRRGR